MSLSPILDVLLILLLLGYLGYGYGAGFVRSVSGLVGVLAGAVAAFFAIPLVGAWVPSPALRLAAVLLAALLLIIVGQAAGAWVGHLIRRRVNRTKLRVVDRVLGAATSVVVVALVASMLAFGIGSLGVPVLSQSIASSNVLRTIDSLTPHPVKGALAQLRSIVIAEGIPRIIDALGGGVAEIPDVATDSPALNAAAQSVVKITGNAFQCGQNQSGSGFVVSPGRVITNAHVVAGVSDPVVSAPGEAARAGTVVYFDPQADLAVIAVPGLDATPLPLTANLPAGADAAVQGYPLGGPFQSSPARVQDVSTVRSADIYGNDPAPLEVYALAASIVEGNSGGPLLSIEGAVAGVVFAKSANAQNVGYAVTMAELAPVAAAAPSLGDPVSAGSCVRR